MIYLFSGQDTYESYKKAKIEANNLVSKTNFELKIIDSDSITNVQKFVDELEGVGMFSESYIILLKRLTDNKKLETYVVENFEILSKYEILIWEDGKADARSKFFKLVKDKGLIYTFEQLKPRDTIKWLDGLLKEKAINLNQNQKEFLVARIGDSKWFLENEVEKIRLFLLNEAAKTISDEDLNVLLGLDAKGDIWEFLDSFGRRNAKATVNEFNKLTRFEDNTQYLIAMVNREISILTKAIYCLENHIRPEVLKLHPFVLSKTLEKAKRFTINDLKNFSKKLFDLDLAIKKGEIDDKLGLTLYLSLI